MNIRDCHNPKCCVAFPIKHASSTQRYCSRSCAASVNASKRKPKAKKTRTRPVHDEGLIVLPSKVEQPLMTLTCAYCKDTFQKRRKERFCSNVCRSFAEHVRPITNVLDIGSFEDQPTQVPDLPIEPPSKAS